LLSCGGYFPTWLGKLGLAARARRKRGHEYKHRCQLGYKNTDTSTNFDNQLAIDHAHWRPAPTNSLGKQVTT
jgi:hypothetical protein